MKHNAFIAPWLVLLTLTFSTQRCEPSRTPSRYLIPDGYVGWVNVHFEVDGEPALPTEGGHYLFVIPRNGTLRTSSRLEGGVANDDFYYINAKGNRQKLESTGWGEGGMIWAESTGNDNEGKIYERFFVGTEKQLKDYGFKMDKPVGPISSLLSVGQIEADPAQAVLKL
jgi:hypothetical protein